MGREVPEGRELGVYRLITIIECNSFFFLCVLQEDRPSESSNLVRPDPFKEGKEEVFHVVSSPFYKAGFFYEAESLNGAETNCGIAHIVGILLINSYDSGIDI